MEKSIYNFGLQALECSLIAAGHKFPRLSRLSASNQESQNGFPVRIPTTTDTFGMAVLDMTIDITGKIRLIEANGSNSGLTSVSMGNDSIRVNHIVSSIKQKLETIACHKLIVLFPYREGFMHLAEFYDRVQKVAIEISKIASTQIFNNDDTLGNEDISIICGTVNNLAKHIECEGNILVFKNRKIIFTTNPNIIPELVRLNKLKYENLNSNKYSDVFHDGLMLYTANNKNTQQLNTAGSGIERIFSQEVWSIDNLFESIRDFHRQGRVAVAKINAGSGGTGIEFFPPDDGDLIVNKKISSLIRSSTDTYSKNAVLTFLPIRLFEFVESTPFTLDSMEHLWDIRIQCLIYPNYTEILPCLIRICPAPFNRKSFNRDSVVSNLTGRTPSLKFIRSALNIDTLKQLNLDYESLMKICVASAKYCEMSAKKAVEIEECKT